MKDLLESPILAELKGRAFFITGQGYVGLTRPSAREGDFVAILHGGRTPFVLRENLRDLYSRYHLVAQR